ncbi:hypothetical protein AB9P61_000141 [Escherichia coli]|nr:hypothetical protein [Escherichia coli]
MQIRDVVDGIAWQDLRVVSLTQIWVNGPIWSVVWQESVKSPALSS